MDSSSGMKPTFNLEDDIELDDGVYRILQRSSSLVKLLHLKLKHVITMSLAELRRRAVSVAAHIASRPHRLDVMTDLEKVQVSERTRHMVELLTGVFPGKAKRNPAYDPATNLADRVTRKAAELHVCERTIWRWKRQFEEDPQTGLVDKRWFRRGHAYAKLTTDLSKAFAAVLADYPEEPTVPLAELIEQTKAKYIELHRQPAPKLAQATWYKYLNFMRGRTNLKATAKARRSEARRPSGPMLTRVPTRPGELVELDATRLDVECILPSGRPGFLTVSSAIDVCSSGILAFTVGAFGTRGTDQVALIAQMVTMPESRHGLLEARRRLMRDHPNAGLLPPDEFERLILHKPFVYPSQMTMDNGSDFQSNTVYNASRARGISMVFASPGQPTTKPHIERFNGEMNRGFAASQVGYVGDSAVNKGRRKHDLLPWDLLLHLLFDWIYGTYNTTPRRGIHPLHAGRKYSPYEIMEQAEDIASTIVETALPLTAEEFVRSLPTDTRVLSDAGIRFAKHDYWNDDLNALRTVQTITQGLSKGQIRFHFDPDVRDRIWAIGASGELIECRIRGIDLWDALPHSSERMAAIRRKQDKVITSTITNLVTGGPIRPWIAPAQDPNVDEEISDDDFEMELAVANTGDTGLFDPDEDPF
jgi:transposase InsO family protein